MVDGIGDAVYGSIQRWLEIASNRNLVEGLRSAGVLFDNLPAVSVADTLLGMSILVTGTLSAYKRDEVKDIIKSHGGKAASGVTSNTTLLVAGEKAAPPKVKKAIELGIPVLDEAQFLELLRTGHVPRIEQ